MAANVHGSSGSTPYSNALQQPRKHPRGHQPRGDADEDEAERMAEHETKHRRGRRAQRHANADFLGPLAHRVRHHAVDADRRERERDEREHADEDRDRARRAIVLPTTSVERADVRPATPAPSRCTSARDAGRERRRILLACARRSVMPKPGRCDRGTKIVCGPGPSSVDLMLPTTPTIVHSTSSLPLAWSTLMRSRRPSGLSIRELVPDELLADDRDGQPSRRCRTSEKSRPAICGIPIVLKKSGVTGRTWLRGSCPSAGFGAIDAPEAGADARERNGLARGARACCTPGSAAMRGQ